jgi:hypothetical protein
MSVFQVGDLVSFLNDVGGGKIIRFNSPDEAVVETEDGFDIPYPVQQLLKTGTALQQEKAYGIGADVIDGFVDKRIKSVAEQKKDHDFERKFRHLEPMKRKENLVEIDLHIHQLVDSEKGLEPADMLDIQLKHFERMLETAIREKRTKIVFIHGKGEGVLKNEIRKVMQFYPNCTFQDAPFNIYGHDGATEVTIYPNR